MESTLEGESMELDAANLTDHSGWWNKQSTYTSAWLWRPKFLSMLPAYPSYHSSRRGNRQSLSSSLISKRQSKSVWRFHRMCSREPTRWSS